MRRDLPPDLVQQVTAYTNFPWWNGEAYAEFVGYPQRIKNQEATIRNAVDDLAEVMNWLREEKHYAQSDRIRTIAGRLARSMPLRPDLQGTVTEIAKGWK